MTSMNAKKIISAIIVFLLFACQAFGADEETLCKIGVLAKRGPERCKEKWMPTAEYLSSVIPDKTFVIIPIKFDDINHSVEKGEVDFILANPAIYVKLESLYKISSIATLRNLCLDSDYTTFAGVIFCRAGRDDILHMSDLKGKTFMAVSRN